MLTLPLYHRFIEHAPPATPRLPGTPTGWGLSDGHVICADCASRITGRGCDFRGVQPIWDIPVKCDGCGAGADDFQLANDAPKHKPQRFENEPTRQRVLVDGMDCLPGQLDLF